VESGGESRGFGPFFHRNVYLKRVIRNFPTTVPAI